MEPAPRTAPRPRPPPRLGACGSHLDAAEASKVAGRRREATRGSRAAELARSGGPMVGTERPEPRDRARRACGAGTARVPAARHFCFTL